MNDVSFMLVYITPIHSRKWNFTVNKLILFKMKKLIYILCLCIAFAMQSCVATVRPMGGGGDHDHHDHDHHDHDHHDDHH